MQVIRLLLPSAALVAGAQLFCACPAPRPVVPPPDADAAGPEPAPAPPPEPAPEAGPPGPPGQEACELACANLARLGCPEAAPDAGALTCVPVCVHTVGTPFNVNPDCVREAGDVVSVRACGTVKCAGR